MGVRLVRVGCSPSRRGTVDRYVYATPDRRFTMMYDDSQQRWLVTDTRTGAKHFTMSRKESQELIARLVEGA